VLRVGDGRVGRHLKREREHVAGLRGLDDAIVPQARRGEVGRRFLVVALPCLLVVLAHFRLAERLARTLGRAHAHLGEHARCLLASHDANLGVRPHEHEPRAVGAPAHAVIAGAERAADHDGELGHGGGGDGVHELRAVFRDALSLVLLAHHETGDVLHEEKRHLALAAELHKVRALDSGLGEEDAVVGDHAHGVAVDPAEARHERLAVLLLELVER